MATVTRLECHINTHDRPGSGTGGDVFLGIGGREFRLDTASDDFGQGDMQFYILGEDRNVKFPNENDPRFDSVVDTDTLARFPVYLRIEPENDGDHWRLRSAAVLVYQEPSEFAGAYAIQTVNDGLVLGRNTGKVIHLLKIGQSEATLRATLAKRP